MLGWASKVGRSAMGNKIFLWCLTDIRGHGTSNPDVQAALNNSLREPLTLLGRVFSNLKLKNNPFKIFNPSSKEAIEEFAVDDSLQPTDTTVKQVEKKRTLIDPKLPANILNTLKHIPDPMSEGEMYKLFDESYGTITTKKHRPSMSKVHKGTNHGMPLSPTEQTPRNRMVLALYDHCGNWRHIYSKKKSWYMLIGRR